MRALSLLVSFFSFFFYLFSIFVPLLSVKLLSIGPKPILNQEAIYVAHPLTLIEAKSGKLNA